MTNSPVQPDTSASRSPTAARWLLGCYWLALAVATHWPNLTITPRSDEQALGIFLHYDKAAHIAVFAVFMLLLAASRFAGRMLSASQQLLIALLVAAVYACVDETTQMLTERTFSFKDLLGNQVGVFGAAAVWVLVKARRTDALSKLTTPAKLVLIATTLLGLGLVIELPLHGLLLAAVCLLSLLLLGAYALSQRTPRRHDASVVDAVEADRGDEPQRTSAGFVKHSRTVGLLTLVSRFAGLVRESALGAVFGLTWITDAFVIGFMVPNLFRRLFGEGALSAAFIPTYTDLLKRDRQSAQRLASACVALVLVVVGTLVLLCELGLWMVLAAGTHSTETSLAIRLTMVMLPYAPLVCVIALLAGLLQVHGRFGPAAAAPILLNLFMIAALGLVSLADGTIFIVAASVTIAGFVQLLWLTLTTLRYESFTRRFEGTGRALRGMGVMMLPMVLGLAVFQINALVDLLIAMGLSPKADGPAMLSLFGWQVDYPIAQSGAATALVFAQRLYQFPLGVFGIAIATAIFPALAHAAARGAPTGSFRTIFQQGLRLTMFIGLPATAGLILVREPLVRVIFEYQRFSSEDTARVAMILCGYGSAVWAYSMTHVITRAFYALKDARTPLRISLVMVFFNLTLNLTLVWYLGAAGLAWSTAVTAVCQTVLMLLAIRRHIAAPIDRSVILGWMRTVLVTTVMIAVLIPIMRSYDAEQSRLAAAGYLVMAVLLGVTVFAIGAWALRADELRWLLSRKGESK